jgi:hypothetical protein
MAVIEGGLSGALQEVDPTFLASRVSERPVPARSWISVGARSGPITALAANVPILSLRNLSTNLLLVRRIGFGFVTTTAFTAAQLVDAALYFARAFSASDSGGNAITLVGDQSNHRTSLAAPTSIDLRISNSAALTPGTRVLDTIALARLGKWSASVGDGIDVVADNLIKHGPGSYPLVLAQNEGLVLESGEALGAAGVLRMYVNLEIAEVSTY